MKLYIHWYNFSLDLLIGFFVFTSSPLPWKNGTLKTNFAK